jgi:hypothetical protein
MIGIIEMKYGQMAKINISLSSEILDALRYKEMLSESLIFKAISSIYEMDILLSLPALPAP